MPYKNKADGAKRLREKRLNNPEWAEKDRERKRLEYKNRKRVVPKDHRSRGVSTLRGADGELLKEWTKTERKPDDPPAVPVVPEGMFEKKRSTMLDRQGKALVQWRSFETEKAAEWTQMWAACAEACKEYKGLVLQPVPGPPSYGNTSRLLTALAFGDPHIGMYAWAKECGEDFDTNIAVRDLTNATRMLVDRSPPSDTCLIAEVGDFFHFEDDSMLTPRGKNKLDGDTRTGRVTKLGYLLMRTVVDLSLAKFGKVIVVAARGNHDPYKAVALALWLEAVYENEPRVEVVDNNNPYTFHEFGNNLFGIHHGDGGKWDKLPGVMATYDDGKPWGRCQHRRWFTGHYHEERVRRFPGVTCEQFNTLAPSDYYGHHGGWRSEQSVDSLTFDVEDGLVSRQRVSLKLARKLEV